MTTYRSEWIADEEPPRGAENERPSAANVSAAAAAIRRVLFDDPQATERPAQAGPRGGSRYGGALPPRPGGDVLLRARRARRASRS